MIVSGLSTSALRSETPPNSAEAADATAYNPEMLIVAMERVMVLFDRSALSCFVKHLSLLFLCSGQYCY